MASGLGQEVGRKEGRSYYTGFKYVGKECRRRFRKRYSYSWDKGKEEVG
jgi:hypothetical protein